MPLFPASPVVLIRSLLVAAVLIPQLSAAITPVDLRCDGQPGIAVVSDRPVFQWRIESSGRTAVQSAWRILVASTESGLAADKGDLWDSGRRPASRSPLVEYDGRPLSAGRRAYWKVQVWHQDEGPTAWSEPAVFEVAPVKPRDWAGARWIDDGKPVPARDEDFYQPDPAPLFRREFEVKKPVVRARLHVAGLGYCLPTLNGRRVAGVSLDPPWTAFDKRILFRSHDVGEALQEGRNCLGLAVGNGWHHPLPLRMWGGRNIRDSLPVGRPRVIAMLVIEHPDGTRTVLTTGPDWQVGEGATLRNSIFLGEERDARKHPDGWDRAGHDAAEWRAARVTDDPLDPLIPILDMPPVLETGILPVAAVTTPKADVHIVDFGINFSGVPELRLDVPAGTRILLRYGEILHDDGTLNPMTSVCGQIKGMRKDKEGIERPIGGPGAPEIAWQQDVYIARGGPGETYRPDFTFHAFRYMEITGLPAAPKAADIRGIRLNSALPSAGEFSCSDPLLNRIQEVTLNTFLNNVVSVQSDCPHRERFGYGGDIAVTSEAYMMNFDMAGFYANTIRNWSDAARPDGDFTDTAPFVGIQYCGVGWAMVHPLLLEQHYQHYGDLRIIREQLPAAVRWFELEASKRKDGLVTRGLGDHESMPRIAGPSITTPMFIDTAARMARLSRLVGRTEDAARFEGMGRESARAWAASFLDPASGKVGVGAQSEQVMALGFGAVPADSQEKVFGYLLKELGASGRPTLSTGIFGTRFLMEQLSARGESATALALATRRDFPSWGWMIENGATSLWETWKESDNTFSHNHPMFGSVSAWFQRWLAGIQAAEDAVAFDRVVIRPQVLDGLDWVKGSHRGARGLIRSEWRKSAEGIHFEVVIPPDTLATLHLPGADPAKVAESGSPLDGRFETQSEAGSLRLPLVPGAYHFVVRP